jgi:hypothetical protein
MLAAEIQSKALELYDPELPEVYLESLGEPASTTHPAAGGRGAGRTHVYDTVSAMRASFAAEGLGQRLFKLIRSEIQTGDAGFDGEVYITSSTPEITAEFLKSGEVRAAIRDVVALGGDVQVSSVSVAITAYGSDSGRVLGPGPLAALLAHVRATGG